MTEVITKKNVLLGEFLIKQGLISEDQLEKALKKQRVVGGLLGKSLIDLGFLGETDLINALQTQLGIQSISLEKINIPMEIIHLIPESVAKTYQVLPLHRSNGTLTLGMTDPLNLIAIDVVTRTSGLKIKPVVCQLKDINKAIDHYYKKPSFYVDKKQNIDFKAKHPDDLFESAKKTTDSVRDLAASHLTVTHLVHLILVQAVKEEATNVLIEPLEGLYRIRYKVEGVYREYYSHTKKMGEAIVYTIKNLACLDTEKSNIPQFGNFYIRLDEDDVHLSVSVIPAYYGENVNLKFQGVQNFKTRDELGITENLWKRYTELIKNRNGIVWLVGPAESGKTTTAYSTLNLLDADQMNIFTYERNIYKPFDKFRQVQSNFNRNKQDLAAITEQQPDVTLFDADEDELLHCLDNQRMIGKKMIVVLSAPTISTAISKILHKVENQFDIITNSLCMIQQLLAERNCQACAAQYNLKTDAKKLVKKWLGADVQTGYQGTGCSECRNTGHKGRIGIYSYIEFGKITDEKMCSARLSIRDVEKMSSVFMYTLKEDLTTRAEQGIISYQEAVRVIRRVS